MRVNRIVSLLVTFIFLACAWPAQAGKGMEKDIHAYKPGEVLVKYREKALDWDKGRTRGSVNGVRAWRLRHLKVEMIVLGPGMAVPGAVKILMDDPLVEYAEPNWRVQWLGRVLPNDPLFNSGDQWYLDTAPVQGTIGQNTYDIDIDIDAPEGWGVMASTISTSMKVSVGVLDSGLSESGAFSNSAGFIPSHEDMFNSLVFVKSIELPADSFDQDSNGLEDDANGWDWLDDDNTPADTAAIDDLHGTLVSGIIASAWNNNTGMAGIGNNALKILPLRALFLSDILGGIDYAIFAINSASANGSQYSDPPPKVLNASFLINESNLLRSAIADAGAAGIVFVAAAGNDGTDNDLWPVYPANYSTSLSNVLAVGATGLVGGLTSFSNFGPSSVQITAPGENILSTYRDLNPNKYSAVDGTSFSAPITASVLGVIMAAHPTMSPSEAINRLLLGGDYDARLAGLIGSGKRVNLAGALAPFYPWSGLAPMDAATLPIVMYTDFMSSLYGTITSAVSSSDSIATITTTSAQSLEIDGVSPGSATFTVTFQSGPVANFETGPWRVTAIKPFSARIETGDVLQFSTPLSAVSSSLSWEISNPAVGMIDLQTGRFVASNVGYTRVILKDAGLEVDRSGYIVIDQRVNQLPSVTISSGPDSIVNSTTASFVWVGSDSDGSISGYYRSLDAPIDPDVWTTATTWTATNLSFGSHVFYIKSEDDLGDTSPIEIWAFTVNTPPDVDLISGPDPILNTSTAYFAWSGSDLDGAISGYFFSIDTPTDPDTWTTATDRAISNILAGTHTFYLKALDNDGGLSDIKTWNFSVNDLPAVNIISGPASVIVDTTVTMQWQGSDNDGTIAGYYWSFDTPADPDTWTPEVTLTLNSISTGSHTFYLKAVDNDGGQSNIQTTDFTVNSPPTVSITSGPSGTINVTTATFQWSGQDSDGVVARYHYSMDDPTPSIQSSETLRIFTNLSEGVHTFYLKAEDNNGAFSEVVSNAFTVVIDTNTSSDGGGGGGCFIATAAYGSYEAPTVRILRDFRDKHLLTNKFGKWFVSLYYKHSPPVADWLNKNHWGKPLVRLLLKPLVLFAWMVLNLSVFQMFGLSMLLMVWLHWISRLFPARPSQFV